MKDHDIDTVYTTLCKTMTDLGEAQAPLFLARFALLAIVQISDPVAVIRIIDDAAADLPQ